VPRATSSGEVVGLVGGGGVVGVPGVAGVVGVSGAVGVPGLEVPGAGLVLPGLSGVPLLVPSPPLLPPPPQPARLAAMTSSGIVARRPGWAVKSRAIFIYSDNC